MIVSDTQIRLTRKLARYFRRKAFPEEGHFWEYFGRIKFASEHILRSGLKKYSVLDVGGATGNNLLKKFGVENVTTLDLIEGADIVASAAQIPKPDGSFDFVTSLDMMEHVPRSLRSSVINELVRVAGKEVILIAPVESPENIWAEEFVLSYRPTEAFLIEHKEQGLVDFVEIEKELTAMIAKGKLKSYQRTGIDNLQTWVSLMMEGYCDTSEVYRSSYEKLENRFVPRRAALVISKI